MREANQLVLRERHLVRDGRWLGKRKGGCGGKRLVEEKEK